MQLLLDVNIDIYPVELGDKLTVALAKSLTDNEMDDGVFNQSSRASLADDYEYVMYGKVFKCLEDKGSKVYARSQPSSRFWWPSFNVQNFSCTQFGLRVVRWSTDDA